MLEIPPRFFDTTYDGTRYPGARGVSGLEDGANCQQFAYELLRHFGRKISDFRSSELWSDTTDTERVENLEPLDLLLFNNTDEAYGAHVAVYLGDGFAIHLAKSVGKPAIWPVAAFQEKPEYSVFIGAKRARVV
jgi:cell wall-associated NlpC family hydrolase